MTAFFAGLALGIAGSAHCAGMCGPLVLALGPGASARRATRVRIAGTYHSGRLLIYVVLGLGELHARLSTMILGAEDERAVRGADPHPFVRLSSTALEVTQRAGGARRGRPARRAGATAVTRAVGAEEGGAAERQDPRSRQLIKCCSVLFGAVRG